MRGYRGLKAQPLSSLLRQQKGKIVFLAEVLTEVLTEVITTAKRNIEEKSPNLVDTEKLHVRLV